MIDRNGKEILVGFSVKELIWLKAANSLPAGERHSALIDISQMSGRTFRSCVYKANELRRMDAWERARQARIELVGVYTVRAGAPPVRPLAANAGD